MKIMTMLSAGGAHGTGDLGCGDDDDGGES